MGMYYNIELKNNEEIGYIDFPYSLSYFFEQIGGYEDKSIVSQIEKILKIDLSIFQKTYNDDFEDFDNEIDENHFWINIEELINKLEEFKDKAEMNKNYFSKVVLNSIDDRNVYQDFNYDYEKIINYQQENPLSLYPSDNGIINEELLKNSINELLNTLGEIKRNGETEIRLIYG
nr:hypothetical protein [uncultured Flavobacterium sp.]